MNAVSETRPSARVRNVYVEFRGGDAEVDWNEEMVEVSWKGICLSSDLTSACEEQIAGMMHMGNSPEDYHMRCISGIQIVGVVEHDVLQFECLRLLPGTCISASSSFL